MVSLQKVDSGMDIKSCLWTSSALAVQIYLQLDRLDLARNEVATVKTWAEDALLLQMMEAWVDLRVVKIQKMTTIVKTDTD